MYTPFQAHTREHDTLANKERERENEVNRFDLGFIFAIKSPNATHPALIRSTRNARAGSSQ